MDQVHPTRENATRILTSISLPSTGTLPTVFVFDRKLQMVMGQVILGTRRGE